LEERERESEKKKKNYKGKKEKIKTMNIWSCIAIEERKLCGMTFYPKRRSACS